MVQITSMVNAMVDMGRLDIFLIPLVLSKFTMKLIENTSSLSKEKSNHLFVKD